MWKPCARAPTCGSRCASWPRDGPGGNRPRSRGDVTEGRERTTGMTEATLDLATVWDQIRERLATSLSPQQNAMLNLTRPLGLVEDTAVLAAPNECTQTVLESRMRRVLAEALSERFGRDIRVAVQLEDAPAEQSEERDEEPTRRPWSAVEAQRAAEDEAHRERTDDGRSAFGVRADAVGRAPWDRGPVIGPLSDRGTGEPARPAEPVGLRNGQVIDRGSPEDWSTPGTRATSWRAAAAEPEDDGPDAAVLPF